ncbi:MAG: hypothetical protein KC550_00420 [Nanoarchaeota archaeon]|nr:hypothetical protein [Nanoarchaeota archaeon]
MENKTNLTNKIKLIALAGIPIISLGFMREYYLNKKDSILGQFEQNRCERELITIEKYKIDYNKFQNTGDGGVKTLAYFSDSYDEISAKCKQYQQNCNKDYSCNFD